MTKSLSKNIETLLWDIDSASAGLNSILLYERILNYGDIDEVRWLFENFDKDDIQSFVQTKGVRRLNKKSLAFWRGYFGIKDLFRDTTGKAEGAFGEDKWL